MNFSILFQSNRSQPAIGLKQTPKARVSTNQTLSNLCLILFLGTEFLRICFSLSNENSVWWNEHFSSEYKIICSQKYDSSPNL
jgi:hypothetical protein